MAQYLTKELDWFLCALDEKFNVDRLVDDVAVEATELGIDEVEAYFIPREVLTDLPLTLLYEIMVADDDVGNEWVGAVAFYPESPEWCLQVITKNGQLVYRKTLPLSD